MRLLIVDDEQSICWGLSRLGAQLGHEVETAASAEDGLTAAKRQAPDLVVLDVRLPGMDGLQALEHFHRLAPQTPVVIITAYGDLATAVAAVRGGAFEYLVKPFDLPVAQRVIERALRWRADQAHAGPAASAPAVHAAGLVGQSAVMQEVFKRIALVAASEACVQIGGESGTGKELVARAIHQFSRRATGPFVAVNIAALNPALAESELFGHVRGAFTGAEQPHDGLFARSHGGTIFLDEVADIPAALQVKILRALEHGEVLPVGAGRLVQVDLRVISATHQNLAELVRAGTFRHDLYFRLSTFQIDLPPLCDRLDDVPPLAEHFLAALADKNASPPARLAPEALAELQRRPWHGNVRELKNALEHALVLARGGVIGVEHLPPPVAAPRDSRVGELNREMEIADAVRRWIDGRLSNGADPNDLYQEVLNLIEPPLLTAVLEKHHGQRTAAARTLGLHRMTLRKKLAELGLDPKSHDEPDERR